MKHFFFPKRRPRQFGLYRRTVDPERAHPDPLALIRDTRYKAIQTGVALLSEVSDDLKRGESSQLEYYWERLPFLFNVVELANETSRLYRENKPAASQEVEQEVASVPTFLVSSLFLSECAAYLTNSPRGHERLHLVTGIKLSQTSRTLERMVNVELESESAIHAQANQQELQKALIGMDEWGHYLYGLFHSHPGKSAHATQPSSTDLKTHERYESGGYPLVGAIFVKDGSKDGFCRFFSNQPFTITVYGKGVEKIEEDENQYVYKINNLSNNLQVQKA
jgi:hypothetical protein